MPDESSRRTRTDDGVNARWIILQALEVFGSLLILVPFGAAQRRSLSTHSIIYLLPNLIGSAILAVTALIEVQLGFLLLEGCWAIVSAVGLIGGVHGTVAPGQVLVVRAMATDHDRSEHATRRWHRNSKGVS